MSNRLPIETAPKDGAPIIVHGGSISEGIRSDDNRHGVVVVWRSIDGMEGWWVDAAGLEYPIGVGNPTHWEPTPGSVALLLDAAANLIEIADSEYLGNGISEALTQNNAEFDEILRYAKARAALKNPPVESK